MSSQPPQMAKPRLTGTLSIQILTASLFILGTALALVSMFATISVRNYLMEQTDNNLLSSGQIVASQTIDAILSGTGETILPNDFYLYVDNYYGPPIEAVHYSVVDRYGRPADPQTLVMIPRAEPQTVPGTITNTNWRIITVPLMSAKQVDEQIGTVLIGLPLAKIDLAVSALQRVLGIFVLIVIAFGAVISYFIVQRSLRGIREIIHVTGEVKAGNYAARVPEGPPGSEVGMLGESINAMLSEIETSFAARAASERRMRQFVSDASHELRTPLASIRGYAELYRMGGVPADQVDMAFARVEAESGRMAHLVEDLLQLARLDEQRPEKWKHVDLAATALNTVSDFLARSPDRVATVTNLEGGEVESVVITADQDRIIQLFTNLLGNVATHTPPDTPVEVAVGLCPDEDCVAVVEVRDHGPGIDDADRERIFERFYRTDTSRYRGSGGSGLGLAIVAAIMGRHHGHAQVLETPGGGLTVRLKFPNAIVDTSGEAASADDPKSGEKNTEKSGGQKSTKLGRIFLPKRSNTGSIPKVSGDKPADN
ncbi:MAG: HAMP domain-containing histidine kinase [Actinomycetaceae bacterium]|nr:HAMP domain-containing histidine kinase [Actinomycetaceae bacterium]